MGKKVIKNLKLVSDRQKMVDILLGKSKIADTVLQGGSVVNVITREIYQADVAISGKYILMVGDCSSLVGKKTKIYDMTGKYIMPGFIDCHMHFESAMLTATEFSRLSIPTGTTCLITDPHEIGNVLGPVGIKAMAEEAAQMPQHVFCRVPALTPDAPGLETAGYNVTSEDLTEMLQYPSVSGVGEIQGVSNIRFVYEHNYPVIQDTIVSSVFARSEGKEVDGNAPGLMGKELAAHIICGGTDISCHETTTKEEAIEKLRNGVYLLMRDGSTQRNMPECIKAVTEEGLDSRRAILATDDMLAGDIAVTGHMNDIIRRTIREGVEPVEAIQMATINPATWLGLTELGVLAPGKLADIAVVTGTLKDMNVSEVFLSGKLVAKDRKLLIPLKHYTYPDVVKHSVKRAPVSPDDLKVACDISNPTINCIGLIIDQNLTDAVTEEMHTSGGYVEPDLDRDLLPIANVGRHGQSDIGATFVKGFGMKRGAYAESVAHDTHNIVVLGTNYEDMAVAVNHVIEMQGGVAVVDSKKVIGDLPLRVAGLITDEIDAFELTDRMNELTSLVMNRLGCKAHAPFMHLAFLSLTTSPVWKLTDKGIIDANNYCTVPVVAEK